VKPEQIEGIIIRDTADEEEKQQEQELVGRRGRRRSRLKAFMSCLTQKNVRTVFMLFHCYI
jgi:phosphatidate phosphatase APP1